MLNCILKIFQWQEKQEQQQVNYAKNGGTEKYYASSFVGYFPAENPKYSCIVVVHKPIHQIIIIMVPMLLDPFLNELHKRFLPMHLRQMRLKTLTEKYQNKKKITIPIITKSQKNRYH